MRKRPLFLGAVVFLTGLVCCRYQRYELLAVLSVWLLYELICGRKNKKKMLMAGRCVLLLSAFFLGFFHMATEMAFRDTYMSKMKDGETVTVWGEVIKKEWKESSLSYSIYLSDCYISLKGETIPCNDVIVYSSKHQFEIGDIHKITGELHIFGRARNEGGFDSFIYYQSLKMDFAVYEKESHLMAKGDDWMKTAILSLKNQIKQTFENHTTERTAGFLSGMLLGDKSNLEKDLKDLFTDGGLAHILAISGLHVSIIGRGFYSNLRKRGVGFALAGLLGGLLLIAYCFMVGNGMSAVRAVGMMLIFFTGQILGRSYDMLNSLGAMVLVLLWENPFLLEYSGFWFSVSALVGVGFVGSIWGKFGMSVGITLTTLPLVALGYYEIPLYSPLTNFLLLPLLTPIFIFALAGGVIGSVMGESVPWLIDMLLYPCQLGLELYEWVCGFIGEFPFATIITGEPSAGVVVVYYGILLGGTYYIKTHYTFEQKVKRRVAKKINGQGYLLGATMAMACLILIIYPKPQPKEITFLDVGQGDGIYISTGDGTNFFIDGGSAFSDSLGEYTILPFLKSRGITRVDYWFVSHADTDHISGLLEVLENGYNVEHLVVSRYAPRDEKLSEILLAAEENGTKVLFMEAGDLIQTDGASMGCIYPGRKDVSDIPELAEDRNEGSLVLELYFEKFGEVQDFYGFFSGDISSEVEEVLLSQNRLSKVWLYKAAHHGSKYSNSMELLEVISPEVAVISCGKNNRYGHPGPEVIENLMLVGADIYYTMDVGQVTLREKDEKIEIISVVTTPNF